MGSISTALTMWSHERHHVMTAMLFKRAVDSYRPHYTIVVLIMFLITKIRNTSLWLRYISLFEQRMRQDHTKVNLTKTAKS